MHFDLSECCCFCWNVITTPSPRRKKRQQEEDPESPLISPSPAKVKLFLNYLVDTKCQKFARIREDVVALLLLTVHGSRGSMGDGAEGRPRRRMMGICENCKIQIVAVSELHEQLEVTQMKLVNVLKTAKRRIGGKMGEGDADLGWNDNEVEAGTEGQSILAEGREGLKEETRILETLKAFRAAVLELDTQLIEIPRVFLQQYTHFRPDIARVSAVIKTEGDTSSRTCLEEFDNHCFSPPDENVALSDHHGDGELKTSSPEEESSSPEVTMKEKRRSKKKARSSSRISRSTVDLFKRKKKSKSPKVPHIPSASDQKSPIKSRTVVLPAFALKPHSKGIAKYRPETLYACDSCPYTTPNSHCFEHHLRTHEKNIANAPLTPSSSQLPLFTCSKCENPPTFRVKQLFEFHMAGHEGQYTIPCDLCAEKCPPLTLISHMKTHQDKIFPCPNCSYCGATREGYLDHLRLHVRGSIQECDLCGLLFETRSKLLSHYDEGHQAIEKHVCDVTTCGKEFLDSLLLQKHKSVHNNNDYACSQCDKNFATVTSLRSHLLQHTGERPFACEHCGEGYPTKAHLNRHLVRKHGAPKLQCPYCDNQYTEKASLNIHMSLHTGDGFPCAECGKMFGSKKLLNRHMVVHSTERSFVCDECGACFNLKNSWHKHMLIHRGDKKFQCQWCAKTFLFERYLITHTRIHTGERPFVCEACGKDFNQQAALYMHRRKCRLVDGLPPVKRRDERTKKIKTKIPPKEAVKQKRNEPPTSLPNEGPPNNYLPITL